ncbi:ankyrin repeat-containing domain protein [Chytriomyces sp. MP71]|nr:ankyrin repeat-containing domain protein [Chytriomyces sp. MP71]
MGSGPKPPPLQHPPHCGCATHAPANASVMQTLDEMAFERSAHAASVAGNRAKLSKLIVANPSCANAFDAAGYTPLHYASRHGRIECVALLLDAGASIDTPTRGLGTTALMRAIAGNHVDVARLLVARGADPDITDSEGRTARHFVDASPEAADSFSCMHLK